MAKTQRSQGYKELFDIIITERPWIINIASLPTTAPVKIMIPFWDRFSLFLKKPM